MTTTEQWREVDPEDVLEEMVVEGEDEDTGAAIVRWRTKKPKSWTEVDRNGEGVVKYLLGGREYDLVTVSTCHTCTSEYRFEIEDNLLRSYGYKRILDSLPEGHGLSVGSLTNHFQKHMPVQQSVRRAAMEAHARDRGLDVDSFEGALANHITLSKLVVQEVVEGLMEGRLNPDLKDGVAFARLLAQVQKSEETEEAMEDLQTAWSIFWEEAAQVIDPQHLQILGERINSNPRTKALQAKFAERRGIEG